ncbi:TIGR03016 family PEP-CTERM system-associated outer membrane protein [Neptunomonas japonica]|uniref:TIGR03016 family PEP-CTERM system-associated outer membrane protein n=1 Tax=Neptunomonas japonica TaxID=417574 RepID=UPI0004240E70|nr:TIGR03016 family PEP-CTERM system-associated outer membrane protein [Neptunomonas japonica]
MSRKLNNVLALGALLGGAVSVSVSAADWTSTKSVTLSEIYTDNADLSHDQQRSELITTITPNLSLQGKGGRANLTLNASLEVNNSSGASSSFNPRLGADGDVEILEDFLFVDASANITQNTVDAFRPSGTDRLSDTDNTTNTYNYQISPHFTQRYKGVAELTGRYTHNYQLNSDNDVGDSSSQAFVLSLNNGTDFKQLTWGGSLNYKDSGGDSSSELLSTDANLGYKFNRSWQVRGSAGFEWNEFDTQRSDNDGVRWDMSAIWTPSSRTSLNIGYGDRFFGSTPTLDFTHRSRRSLFSASYSRELTDSASLLSEQSAFNTTNAAGQAIDPITGDPLPLTNSTFNIADGVFVNEKFQLSYTLTGKRSSLTVGASHSIQKFESGRTDETLEKYSASASRRLSSVLDMDLGYVLSRQQRDGDEDAITSEYSAGVARKLGKDSRLKLTYRFIDRESDDLTNDYQENRLQLSFTTSL